MELDESLILALDNLPPVSDERLRILHPLTDEQLVRCFRQTRLDLVDHIRARHLGRVRSHLPSSHRPNAFDSLIELQEDREFRDFFLRVVSNGVSEYWSHVTKGHRAPPSSAEDYLRWLVQRVRRTRSTWWLRRQDRRVVRARGAPSGRT